MNRLVKFIPLFISIILASIYIYPIFSGLILLPLDLLVSNSSPWHWASTILLKNPYMSDSIIQMYPWRHLTLSSISAGIMPLWNPNQFMGIPFMAGMKPLVFYPGNIFFIFGELQSWNWLLWSQLCCSLFFSYIFARSMGVRVIPSFLSGITFAFCSLMIGVLEFGSEGHVLMWLPLILYFINRYLQSDSPWLLLGISFAVTTSLLAGHLQYFAYIMVLAVAFTVFEAWTHTKRFRQIFRVLVFISIGIGISAIQTVPGIELFIHSYRGSADSYAIFSNGLLTPSSLLRLLSPDWFGNPVTHDLTGGYIEMAGYFGIIPLFFVLFSLLNIKLNKYITFFWITAVTALLFSMNGPAQLLYYLKIPLITSGYGGRLFVLFLFSCSVLSGFGLQTFINEPNSKRRIKSVVIFVIAVGLGFVVSGVTFTNIKMQIASVVAFTFICVGYFIFYRKIRFAKVFFLAAIFVLTYGDLFRMGYRFLTFSNPKFLYPEIPVVSFVQTATETSLGRTYGITEPEINGVFQIPGVETYNPLYPLRTALFMQALEGKTGSELPINKYYISQNQRMKYVLDFLGVTHIVPGKGKNPALEYWQDPTLQGTLTKVYEDENQDVYENVTAYPRYSLFFQVMAGTTDKVALRMIEERSIDFRKTLLIQENIQWKNTDGTGSARLVKKNMNSLRFSVKSSSRGLFYLSDTYFPGWHASVNGREVPILHANYNFRAVMVPDGVSEVEFWYLPMSFIAGIIISLVSLLTSIILMLILIRSKHGKTNETQSRKKSHKTNV